MTWHIFSKGKSCKPIYRKHSLCMTLNFLKLHKGCYHLIVKHFCILVFYTKVEKLVKRFLSGRKATEIGDWGEWEHVCRDTDGSWRCTATDFSLHTCQEWWQAGEYSHEIYMENLLYASSVLGGLMIAHLSYQNPHHNQRQCSNLRIS